MSSPPIPLEELLQQGYRYALALTANTHLAEDVLQEAWLSVLRAQGPHPPIKFTKAYLFTAIRSRFFNHYKKEQRIALVPLDEDSFGNNEDIATDEILFEPVPAASLHQALDKLRNVEREVFYLYAVEEYTSTEIAALLKTNRGTITNLIFRTRKKLQSLLATEFKQVKP